MKRIVFILFLILGILPSTANIYLNIKIGFYNYDLDDSTNEATLKGINYSVTNIIDVIIPETVEYKDVVYSVTAIGDEAFSYSTRISGKLVIPNSVTSIGKKAFQYCKNLTGSLIIPNSVHTIGEMAFSDCYGFNGSLTIGNSVQSIGDRAFYRCSGFTGSLTIGDNVQTIGNEAFSGCYGFTGSLTIPDSVRSIGRLAFSYCSGLTGSLTIGNTVQTIGASAFSGCSGFTGSLTIPNSLQTIEEYAFSGCSGFTGSLTIGNSVQSIGYCAFNNCSGFTGSLTIPDSVRSIGRLAFWGCSGFNGSLTIGNSVQTIEASAFYGCSGFTGSLTIPNSVQTIGEHAFHDCSGFNGTLKIPNSVQTIEECAFSGCSGFTGELIIPDSIKEITFQCFHYCNNLTSLVIPSSVRIINDGSFYCDGLESITCESITPPECIYSLNNNIFGYKIFSKPLYVPAQSIELYKNATEWKKFINILPIPPEATGVNLNKSQLTLLVGQEETLIATLIPEDAVTKVVWSLGNNNKVVSINQDGKVTALSAGTATVVATAGNVSASCVITVKDAKDVSVKPGDGTNPGDDKNSPGTNTESGGSLQGNDLTLRVNQTAAIALELPENLSAAPTFAWTLDNKGSEFVSMSVAVNTLSATFKGLKVGQTGYTVSIVGANGNIEAVKGRITVIAEIPMQSLSLEPVEVSMAQNAQPIQLQTIVSPANATMKEFSWRSSEPGVATVSDSGLVSPVSQGETTITATALDGSGLTAACMVTVTSPIDGNFELEFDDAVMGGVDGVTIYLGDSFTLTPKAQEGFVLPKDITWSSSDSGKVSVDNDGKVTGVAIGEALITATASVNGAEAKASCKVTVIPVPAQSIELNIQDMTLLVGQTDKLKATVSPENTTFPTITWTSDNEAVATVAADGTVTAVSVGVANITATCGEAKATCKVTVNPVAPSSIELSLQDVTLLIGSSVTLTAKLYPENVTNNTIKWSSSIPSVATIDDNGTVTALQEGVTTITATCGPASATCNVTVTPISPSSIELNIRDMVLFIGQSETIQAIVRPANTTYPTVTWHSDDETVATVSDTGKVTGLTEGTAIITATCGEVSATCNVTVNPIPASNIEITSRNVTLTLGSTTKLAAKVSPDNTTHPDVDWSSSDNNIATIVVDGTVTAVSIGTAIITAKCGNVSATCTVTVIPVPSEGIVISPSEVTMLLEDTFTLSATVYPEDTTDKNVTWGSDNPSVASVSSTGVVTALSIGTARITARNGNSLATCQVTVNPVVATGISLNVKDETIFVASSTQLVATISPFNVTDKTITWTSSKPEIATVSDQGEVLGLSVGTTTVTASIGNVAASSQINVVHRIPDMDPAVTTSNRDIVTLTGRPVNMAVYAEGGEPTGWSYLWTKNGQTVSQSSELNITAVNQTNTVIAETYRVKVENEIDKVVILSEIFDFVVQIYPAVAESPEDGGGISVATGTDSTSKTREGNVVTLSAATPSGGNPQGWELIWSDAKGEIGEGESVETIAAMSPGNSMAIENAFYNLSMTNYSPEGDVWAQFNLQSNPIEVYRRPQTPLQMLRKGDGSSHTFIAMMTLSDLELEQLDYNFIYGWTDADGNDHVIEQTNERYCHTEAQVYDDPTNRFWVYSIWVYNDGCMVSSGLRYLDGGVDENFDASIFDGSFVHMDKKAQIRTAIYTIDGHYIGTDVSKLVPGIYIHTSINHGMVKTEKIIIR